MQFPRVIPLENRNNVSSRAPFGSCFPCGSHLVRRKPDVASDIEIAMEMAAEPGMAYTRPAVRNIVMVVLHTGIDRF
jgi:hypothetical protein